MGCGGAVLWNAIRLQLENAMQCSSLSGSVHPSCLVMYEVEIVPRVLHFSAFIVTVPFPHYVNYCAALAM